MGDKGRQDLGKADTPSNTGTHVGRDNGRQGETRLREGGHTIQHQAGHLKKALRTPNSTLFVEKFFGWNIILTHMTHRIPDKLDYQPR